jgi:hypothetical protein
VGLWGLCRFVLLLPSLSVSMRAAVRLPEHVCDPGIEMGRGGCWSFLTLLLTVAHNGEAGILQHHGNIAVLTLATLEHTRLHVVHHTVWRELAGVASATERDVVGYDACVTDAACWDVLQ